MLRLRESKMRRGVSLAESVVPGPLTLPALEAWAKEAGGAPALFPLWHRVQTMTLDAGLLHAIKDSGVEPMLYATSTTRDPVISYESYLHGEQDDKLGALADALVRYDRRIIVRWDHEASMKWCPWGDRDPSLYKAVFRYVAERLPRNAKMYYCGGSWPTNLKRYHPGDAATFHGFDEYSKDAAWTPLAEAWAPAIKALDSVQASPIIVGEFGRRDGMPERAKWLRSLDGVTGVWAAIYLDIDLSEQEDMGWRMTPYMRSHYL